MTRWLPLRSRSLPGTHRLGTTGTLTLAMVAEGLNVAPTYVLPGTALRHLVARGGSVSKARRVLEGLNVEQMVPCDTLLDETGPDVVLWPSPALPRGWTWAVAALPQERVLAHGREEVQSAVRQAWLSLLDADVVSAAQRAGISEHQYLAGVSMALLAQAAELHPGLTGRTWSPDVARDNPFCTVQCSLGADEPVWQWRCARDGRIIERPDPPPADEAPVTQSARLTSLLARRVGRACALDWQWDGQELVFLCARPVPLPPEARVFSHRVLQRLNPRSLSPMAGSVAGSLLHDICVDAGTLLLGRSAPATPADVVRQTGGLLYVDVTFVQGLLRRAGLPPQLLEVSLGGMTEGQTPSTTPWFARPVGLVRAGLATRLAVPRLDHWVSTNRADLGSLETLHVEDLGPETTTATLVHVLHLLRTLSMDLLLLSVASTQHAAALQRGLARRGAEAHLEEALHAATDAAGLDPWTHLDRIAARIDDDTARAAARDLARGDAEEALQTLAGDVTTARELDGFRTTFWYFRTGIIDIGSPTLAERADLLPVALLRAWETGARERAQAASDPLAWLDSLPGGRSAALRRRYQALMRTTAVTEKAWFYLGKLLSLVRLLLLHRADQLVQEGRLDRRDDILLLELADLEGTGDLRAIAYGRAAAAPQPAQPQVIVEAQAAGEKVSVVL